MGAGVLGEGPHKLQASGLGRDAGADQRRASLFFNRRSDVLHGTHVEPARGGILALGQADCLARDNCTPFEGFTLPEKLLPGDGLSGRDARCSGNASCGPDKHLHQSSEHPTLSARFAGTRTSDQDCWWAVAAQAPNSTVLSNKKAGADVSFCPGLA